MKLVYSIWVWLLLLVPVESFKILVWPAEWSHWINMKVCNIDGHFIQTEVRNGTSANALEFCTSDSSAGFSTLIKH